MTVIVAPRRTTTAGKVPTTSDLANGEMGINVPDAKIYVRQGSTIKEVANASPANWNTMINKPSTFPSTIALVSGLTSALGDKINTVGNQTIAGSINFTGPDAALHVTDRTSFRSWGWVGQNDRMNLWGGSSFILSVDAAGVILRNSGVLKVGEGFNGTTTMSSASGSVTIGMANAGYCHFYTSAPAFYMDKPIEVNGGISHYGGPRVPRTFVQAADPGSAAADGDLWIW